MTTGKSNTCDGKKWGSIAYNVANAPKCISSCRQRFLQNLVPIDDVQDEDETFIKVCETLSDKTQRHSKDHPFWHLYCCDAQLCGVDNVERLGEDPNINWIINTCSNIGYSSVIDPGPPDATYTCSREAVHGHDPRCQRLKGTSPTATPSSRSIEALTQDTMVPSITRGILSDSTISSIVDPSLTASNVSINAHGSEDGEDPSHSTGEKVAIAISVVVGIVVLVAAVLCLFRIKAIRKRRSRPISPSNTRPGSFPHSSYLSPSTPPPSMHGSDGAPLAPPLRLKERRLLPLGLSVSSWSPPVSFQRGPGFPESPLYSPTKANLIPRKEEMRKTAEIHTAPLLSNVGWMKENGSVRSGNSSCTAGSSTHSGRIRSEPCERSSTQHVRHPSRVHSLASPGSAPNKKLPPTPAESFHSRSFNPSRHGEIGVAIGIVGHNPASGVTLTGPSRDLCELTEEYEREARDSGGSWSGNGGGGPGVALSSPKKLHLAGPTKSTIGEDDLQRMGGRY